MKTNFSLLFYLKKPKNYVKGAVPVYLRITIDGKPVEMSASRKCEPELWNTKAGHMIGTKEDAKINDQGRLKRYNYGDILFATPCNFVGSLSRTI